MRLNEDQIYTLLKSSVEEDLEIGLGLLLSHYKWDQMVAFFSKYGVVVSPAVNHRWEYAIHLPIAWKYSIRHITNKESVITLISGLYLWKYTTKPPSYKCEEIELINH